MTAQEIVEILKGRFGERIRAAFPEDKHPRVHVEGGADAREVLEFLRRDARLSMDWLRCLTGVDYVADGRMAVVYDLWSFEKRHAIAVKAFCAREDARLPSVADLWSAADWQEREAYDLLGITFNGHPDLRRILCADDWVGNPLRKDYVFPREYHGIPGSVELDWQQKPDYPK